MRNIQVSGISSGREGKRSEEQPLRKKWNNKLIPTEHFFKIPYRIAYLSHRKWEYSYLMHCCLTKEAGETLTSRLIPIWLYICEEFCVVAQGRDDRLTEISSRM
jgi:hypothetical protein